VSRVSEYLRAFAGGLDEADGEIRQAQAEMMEEYTKHPLVIELTLKQDGSYALRSSGLRTPRSEYDRSGKWKVSDRGTLILEPPLDWADEVIEVRIVSEREWPLEFPFPETFPGSSQVGIPLLRKASLPGPADPR